MTHRNRKNLMPNNLNEMITNNQRQNDSLTDPNMILITIIDEVKAILEILAPKKRTQITIKTRLKLSKETPIQSKTEMTV